MLALSEDKREPPRVTQLFLIFYLTKFKVTTWHFWFLLSAGYRTGMKHPMPAFAPPKNLVATSVGCLPIVLPHLLWLWYHSANRGTAEQTQRNCTKLGSHGCFCISGDDSFLLASCWGWLQRRLPGGHTVVKNTQQEWNTQLTSAPGIRGRAQERQSLEFWKA